MDAKYVGRIFQNGIYYKGTVRTTLTGLNIEAHYRDLLICIGSPLCIKRQILAKGGSCKGLRASIVEIPTLKVVVPHLGNGKGDLCANNTQNGVCDLGVIANICAGRQLAAKERDLSIQVFAANNANAGKVGFVSAKFTLSCTTYEASLGSYTGCFFPNVSDRLAFGRSTYEAGLGGSAGCICPSVSDRFAFGYTTFGASLGGSAGCICPSVSEGRNYAIRYGRLKRTRCIGVNLAADRASVVFLITCSKTGCGDFLCFCETVRTSKLIYASVFVAFVVANCTFLVLNTFACKGRLRVNYPFVVVSDITDGAASVVTFGIASVRPSVAESLLKYVVASCTGLSRSTGCGCACLVTESRNEAFLYGGFQPLWEYQPAE